MMMPVSVLLLGFCFLATLAINTYEDQLYRNLKPYLDTIIRKNVLEYKDPCAPVYEEVRGTQGRALVDLLSRSTSYNSADLKAGITQAVTAMAMVLGNYCNSYKNLECNPKGQCRCAQSNETNGFKASLELVGDSCLMSTGSICFPLEHFNMKETFSRTNPFSASIPKQDFRCASMNGCVLKNLSSVACTPLEFENRLDQIAKEQGVNHLHQASLFRLMREGICVCKGTTKVPSALYVMIVAAIVNYFL